MENTKNTYKNVQQEEKKARNIFAKLENRVKDNRVAETVLAAAEPVVLAALLILVTGYLVDGSFNPFLYFRF